MIEKVKCQKCKEIHDVEKDADGLISDDACINFSDAMRTMSKAKLEQIKRGLKGNPALADLATELFKIGYGCCVFDHKNDNLRGSRRLAPTEF